MIDPNPIFDGLRKYVSRFFRVNLGAARFAANYFYNYDFTPAHYFSTISFPFYRYIGTYIFL